MGHYDALLLILQNPACLQLQAPFPHQPDWPGYLSSGTPQLALSQAFPHGAEINCLLSIISPDRDPREQGPGLRGHASEPLAETLTFEGRCSGSILRNECRKGSNLSVQ